MKRAGKFLFLNSSSALLATLFVFLACLAYGDVKVVGYYPEWLRSTILAEKVKFEYGSANMNVVNKNDMIDLSHIDERDGFPKHLYKAKDKVFSG